MTTAAFTGKGTVLSINPALTGGTFTSVLQTKSLSFTEPKWSTEDTTNLGSPTFGPGVVKEFIPTLVDPGSLSAQAIYLPSDTGLAALRTAFAAGTQCAFKLQLPIDVAGGQTTAGDLLAFDGYVTDQPIPSVPGPDKVIVYKVSIALTTVVTVTTGS